MSKRDELVVAYDEADRAWTEAHRALEKHDKEVAK